MLVKMKKKQEKIHCQNFFLNKTKTTAALQKGRTERNQSVVHFFQTTYIKNIKSLHSNLLNTKKKHRISGRQNGTNGCEAFKKVMKNKSKLSFFHKTLKNKHSDAEKF